MHFKIIAKFKNCRVIFSKLSEAVSEDEAELYKQKLQELTVKLRYCRHHLGDKTATDKLLEMRGDEGLGDKLDVSGVIKLYLGFIL